MDRITVVALCDKSGHAARSSERAPRHAEPAEEGQASVALYAALSSTYLRLDPARRRRQSSVCAATIRPCHDRVDRVYLWAMVEKASPTGARSIRSADEF